MTTHLHADATAAYGAEAEQMKYAIVIEKGLTGYGAYVPDLPGCRG